MAGKPLNQDTLNNWRKSFYDDPKNVLAQNVCTIRDPFEMAINRRTVQQASHVFNVKIESEAKPVTKQYATGRCWLFAALNVIRLPFMKKYDLEEFEFSQRLHLRHILQIPEELVKHILHSNGLDLGYMFFWDKIERTHYWLNTIVTTAKKGEPLDGRLLAHLLKDPINDGGQWDMFTCIVNKHGLMPKKCFPESFTCENSSRMNAMLKTKLREFSKILREMVEKNASDESIRATIMEQMTVIYNIIAICLGIPPETFTWEYYGKTSKTYGKIGPVTPLEFYEKYVKPVFNVDDKVCLVTDPRPKNPFGRLYTLDCLGNTVGGRQTLYNNQPVETLMNVTLESIRAGEAVWFGCEVSKRFCNSHGLEDLDAHDYKLLFNTEIQTGLNKADRLLYGDSCMTHAMVFTAVGTDDDGKPKKFRVENSYGADVYDKGYLLMTEAWFREFVFEVVCDKQHVPAEVLEVFKQEPIVLPAWDPMGTLAS